MFALVDFQAPILAQHYSSFVDLRKNEFVQVKQETMPEFNSCMAVPLVRPSFLTVPLITVLSVVRRAIMLGLVQRLTIDPILVLLI